ncbi:MAG TPA: HD domain-containing phosphohydrolase [Planctomycetota bacterium]
MRTTRILIVDDEVVNRTLLRGILAPLGYEIVEAADGEAALARVAEALPDLILLDVLMPRMNGYDVCKALKSDPRSRLVPIVLLTGLDKVDDKIKAADVGADEFLTKPFNVAELTTRVRSLLSLKFFTDELEHASTVLESVALVVEGRDHYTGNHCRRLAEYAQRVGRELKVSADDLRILQLGGVFHDLGKIAISDMVLNKPGKLSPEEWQLMRRHPLTGFELCQSMRTMGRVLPLIRNHHEKLDGSGYPDGLKGDEIPLLVRITSVVDVYDALATKRSYKDSLPQARCLEILREEAAKGWWDRDVVEALARIL